MKINRLPQFLLALCLPMMAMNAACAATSSLEGVWSGTIGKSPVLACFDSADTGRYYYASRLYGIELWRDETGRQWSEKTSGDDSTGAWRDLVVDKSELSGQWVSPSNGKALSIRMHRKSDLVREGDGASCRTAAYDQPRLRATAIESGPETTVSGHSMIKLSARDGQLTALQIQESGVGIATLNRTLKDELLRRIVESYECIQSGRPGEYVDNKDEVKFFKDGLIAIGETFNGTCGGPYPASGLSVSTYDALTGEPVGTEEWIRLENGSLPRELLSIISDIEFAPRDSRYAEEDAAIKADCQSAWLEQGSFGYVIWPADGGLYFSPEFPHVIQACGDDVLVPFKQLDPFWSEIGKKALHRLK